MTIELEVVWNGTHHGQNADLLCAILPPNPPPIQVSEQERQAERKRDLSGVRAEVIAALVAQETWTVTVLRRKVGLTPSEMCGVISRLKARGWVKSRGYGRIQWLGERAA